MRQIAEVAGRSRRASHAVREDEDMGVRRPERRCEDGPEARAEAVWA
jgi:hypothetical protein